MLLTPGHYVYVKISEGCNNRCSYCAIPGLRGALRSRSLESVIEEVRQLCERGTVREINLIGQDTTRFGWDRYRKSRLAELLTRLDAVESPIRWIRVLYTHPAHYDDQLISVIANGRKICKYLDLPIQHSSDRILKLMKRRTKRAEIRSLIKKLRREIPGLAIRTSVIVGFPGETDRDFNDLLDFVEESRFERLGVFSYSREEGTEAYAFKGHLPEEVKDARLDKTMRLQQKISREINGSLLGKTIDVMIDEKEGGEPGKYIGRSSHDAPEVDGSVYVSGRGLKIGGFYPVKITGTMEYDLIGERA
jgi:ribosomal protein S12 methylthiotransferase